MGFTSRSQESGSCALLQGHRSVEAGLYFKVTGVWKLCFTSRSQESSSGSAGCNTCTSYMISSAGGHASNRNYIISMLLYSHKFLPLSIFLIPNTVSMDLLENLFPRTPMTCIVVSWWASA